MANIISRRNAPPSQLAGRQSEWDPFERMRELMRWDPFQELSSRWFGGEPQSFMPSFDVREEKDAFVFQADLPGIPEENIDISLTGNRLSISGKREEEQVSSEAGPYYCRERSYGSFSRTFTLPEGADADRIEARMRDGVLSLRVPKAAEAQPKRIAVQGSGGELRGKT